MHARGHTACKGRQSMQGDTMHACAMHACEGMTDQLVGGAAHVKENGLPSSVYNPLRVALIRRHTSKIQEGRPD
eukprot:1157286-Pelagomonas_calceolata.AAC.8